MKLHEWGTQNTSQMNDVYVVPVLLKELSYETPVTVVGLVLTAQQAGTFELITQSGLF